MRITLDSRHFVDLTVNLCAELHNVNKHQAACVRQMVGFTLSPFASIARIPGPSTIPDSPLFRMSRMVSTPVPINEMALGYRLHSSEVRHMPGQRGKQYEDQKFNEVVARLERL